MGKVDSAALEIEKPSGTAGSCAASRIAAISVVIIPDPYPSAPSVLQYIRKQRGDSLMELKKICPDCGEAVSRRSFMKTAATAAVAAAAAKTPVWASTWRLEKPEALVKRFHESLKPEQKELICFGWGDPRRQKVSNNWEIVPQQIGKFFTGDQQQILKDIFRGLVSEDGAARFAKSMKDDYGGFESYHVAMFGDPATSQWEWVLTGRHVTIRCDGNTQENVAFGG